MPEPEKVISPQLKDPAAARSARKSPQRRSTSSKKSAPKARKKAGVKVIIRREAKVPPAEPSDQEIRMRAYFIAERRHRLGLPGDSNSDWLEAKRQLLHEPR